MHGLKGSVTVLVETGSNPYDSTVRISLPAPKNVLWATFGLQNRVYIRNTVAV